VTLVRTGLALAASLGLAGCFQDETVAGYGAADKIWVLTELNGIPFAATATLTFPDRGRIAGQAPCNGYTAEMSVPYPWFEINALVTTRKSCPDLAYEAMYLAQLSRMSLSEILGDVLLLSTPDGEEMVFKVRE
jgi:heat shock protein HslJ